ncbi:MAG: hypothetical protein GY906_23040 [bacterium]|nr:hypothetical protein [bacterium]
MNVLLAAVILLLGLAAPAKSHEAPEINVGDVVPIAWNCEDVGAVEDLGEFLADDDFVGSQVLFKSFHDEPAVTNPRRSARCVSANYLYPVTVKAILRTLIDATTDHRVYVMSYEQPNGRTYYTLFWGAHVNLGDPT